MSLEQPIPEKKPALKWFHILIVAFVGMAIFVLSFLLKVLYPSENGMGLFYFLLWAIPALKICCDTLASKQIFALALPIIKSHKLSQTTFRRV